MKPALPRAEKLRALRKISEAEIFEQLPPYALRRARNAFPSKAAKPSLPRWTRSPNAARNPASRNSSWAWPTAAASTSSSTSSANPTNTFSANFPTNYIPDTTHGDGDVKYHLGYEADCTTSGGKTVHIGLAANPSHLEAVDPRRAGQGPRPPAPPRRHGGAQESRPRPHPWRRRVHRPGRRGGSVQPLAAGGLPHRRHAAFRHQQPNRLHHRARRTRARACIAPTSPR